MNSETPTAIRVRDGIAGPGCYAPGQAVLVSPHPHGVGWPERETEATVESVPPFRDFLTVETADGVRACVFSSQVTPVGERP